MKHFEFWHPRLFEAPYYAYLLGRCALKGFDPRNLPKADYALDHGELGLGSKYSTQMMFDQERFPTTELLDCPQQVTSTPSTGFPAILKPDIGAVGKGINKVESLDGLNGLTGRLHGRFILQSFCADPEEFGIFYIRKAGIQRISGINRKHFPTVVGNGRDTVATLARNHQRYTNHWGLFLKYLDTQRVPADGEQVRLSFVGSHTMGCRFTNDTALLTPALERAVFKLCSTQPGFNFGRLDVKSRSVDALRQGQFTVIEINGIASLPTHMFDPDNTIRDAYQIFLEHGRHLVDIAHEQRNRDMQIDTVSEIWRRARDNHERLNALHQQAIQSEAS